MSSVFSGFIKIQNAQNFVSLLSKFLSDTYVYLTFGKSFPWPDDNSPPQANTSLTVVNDHWRNMIGAKLVTGNDIKLAIPRNDWTSNTVYSAYDDCECSLNLFDPNTKFHVVTSDFNVYKCLFNNNGANSTIMPKQIYTDKAIQESDGYIWKYMYTISDSDKLKFMSESYIPVKTLVEQDASLQWQVQQNAIPGAIHAIKVINSGSNYTNANNITVTITGDGTGANAVARINSISYTISSIVMTTVGSDYTYANVNITSTGGADASARAIISPSGGHGSNPEKELGAYFAMLNIRLNRSENNKFPVTNDYRQIALISNLEKTDGSLANSVTYNQLATAVLDVGSSQYQIDEIVYQGDSIANSTFSGRVVIWDSANNTLKLTDTNGSVKTTQLIGANSAASRFISSFINYELKRYMGSLLYINNIKPITRAEDQSEDYKILLRF